MKQNMLPQELEVWYILPAIRKAFAIEMIRQGIPQKRIAVLLGVTSAAISQYKNDKRAKEIMFNPMVKAEIKKAVERIMKSPDIVFSEVMYINQLLKQSRVFCQIHKEMSPTPKGCEAVCDKYYFEGLIKLRGA